MLISEEVNVGGHDEERQSNQMLSYVGRSNRRTSLEMAVEATLFGDYSFSERLNSSSSDFEDSCQTPTTTNLEKMNDARSIGELSERIPDILSAVWNEKSFDTLSKADTIHEYSETLLDQSKPESNESSSTRRRRSYKGSDNEKLESRSGHSHDDESDSRRRRRTNRDRDSDDDKLESLSRHSHDKREENQRSRRRPRRRSRSRDKKRHESSSKSKSKSRSKQRSHSKSKNRSRSKSRPRTEGSDIVSVSHRSHSKSKQRSHSKSKHRSRSKSKPRTDVSDNVSVSHRSHSKGKQRSRSRSKQRTDASDNVSVSHRSKSVDTKSHSRSRRTEGRSTDSVSTSTSKSRKHQSSRTVESAQEKPPRKGKRDEYIAENSGMRRSKSATALSQPGSHRTGGRSTASVSPSMSNKKHHGSRPTKYISSGCKFDGANSDASSVSSGLRRPLSATSLSQSRPRRTGGRSTETVSTTTSSRKHQVHWGEIDGGGADTASVKSGMRRAQSADALSRSLLSGIETRKDPGRSTEPIHEKSTGMRKGKSVDFSMSEQLIDHPSEKLDKCNSVAYVLKDQKLWNTRGGASNDAPNVDDLLMQSLRPVKSGNDVQSEGGRLRNSVSVDNIISDLKTWNVDSQPETLEAKPTKNKLFSAFHIATQLTKKKNLLGKNNKFVPGMLTGSSDVDKNKAIDAISMYKKMAKKHSGQYNPAAGQTLADRVGHKLDVASVDFSTLKNQDQLRMRVPDGLPLTLFEVGATSEWEK